ncbi:MAG: DUF1292 domain-containing protein [Ruminococcus sp.]|nr:DUF1292 domain-containing protein [Ruminococcus sp.]
MSNINEMEFENNEELDDEGAFITLTDDDGNDVHFEIIDLFPYKDSNYIVLIPFEELDDEVVILEVINPDSDDAEYLSIENEALLNDIFEEFKRRNADNFDFAD